MQTSPNLCEPRKGASTRTTRVLIVDDHPITRAGYVRLLSRQPDLEVCGEAADEAEALQLARELRPDLVIMDARLSAGSGIDLCKRLAARRRGPKILAISAHEDVYAERVLRAGAGGFVSKDEPSSRLLEAVRSVLAGRPFVSEALVQRLLRPQTGVEGSHAWVQCLSDRELEVFEHLGCGRSMGRIGESMNISAKTVESHVEAIKKKLSLTSGREMRCAAARGFFANQLS